MARPFKIGACFSSFALLLGAPHALAQDQGQFGKMGQFAVSGERLFGIVFASQTATQVVNNVEQELKSSYTNINLLVNETGPLVTTYSIPRLAFDYLPIDGLTLGLSLGYFTVSGEVGVPGQPAQDTGSVYGFLLAPRAGYAFLLTPMVGVWPRAGITFLGGGGEDDDGSPTTSMSRLAITVEVPLVVTPVPHAGFTIGPTFDIGISGSNKTTTLATETEPEITTETDITGTDIGVQAGLFRYF